MRPHDPLDLQAQEAARAAQAQREQLAAEQELDDVKWLMGSKRGRRIVWRQLTRAGVFKTSYSHVAMEMAHAEGRKQEGYRLIALVHAAAPTLYPTMVAENQ